MEEQVVQALIRLRDTYLTAKESSQNCADNIQALKQEHQLLNQLLSAQTKISEEEVSKIMSMHDSTVESKEMLKRAEQRLHFLKSKERYVEQLQKTLIAQDENLAEENRKLKSAELQFMLLSPLLKQMLPHHKPTIELYETHLLSTIDHEGLRLWF
ncbi:hypothetical protein SUGI_0856510 [Cryptomeria japonica]|nr:hypothetical protein SUGI_0856510 [Cryptomeria japonica]